MYRESKSPESTMLITFKETQQSSAATEVNLNFQGWRGVWIGYQEFKTDDFKLNKIETIVFEITSLEEDKLYLDVIQFVSSLTKQTRDLVVRKVGYSRQLDQVSPLSSSQTGKCTCQCIFNYLISIT